MYCVEIAVFTTFYLFSESAGVICEFLEVAFGSILYARELYPHTAFERMRKYNVPVQVGHCTDAYRQMDIG